MTDFEVKHRQFLWLAFEFAKATEELIKVTNTKLSPEEINNLKRANKELVESLGEDFHGEPK